MRSVALVPFHFQLNELNLLSVSYIHSPQDYCVPSADVAPPSSFIRRVISDRHSAAPNVPTFNWTGDGKSIGMAK